LKIYEKTLTLSS